MRKYTIAVSYKLLPKDSDIKEVRWREIRVWGEEQSVADHLDIYLHKLTTVMKKDILDSLHYMNTKYPKHRKLRLKGKEIEI